MVFRYNQVKNYILICMCFIGQNLCLIFLNFLVFFTVIMYNINEKIGIIFIINVFFLILYIRLLYIYIYIYIYIFTNRSTGRYIYIYAPKSNFVCQNKM